ncbi:hypothetical protein RUND412_003185 [Rhizina undulata]
MGINGLFTELGSGDRHSLVSIALKHHQVHKRRLRLAIDASIWSFQAQSGKGGSNPALRTLYYRLIRLHSLNITPLFVFDGPKRPDFKRNQKTNGHITPNLSRQTQRLLKLFAFPFHTAPGEAEAECANLQRAGIVDAVLSEDVDTIMFGCGITFRNWSCAGTKGKTPTHVSVYKLDDITEATGLTPAGMIMVALMSGGDYLTQGVLGCGIKTAIEAAKAGFGDDLCALEKDDVAGLKEWRERLKYELESNESGWFKRKHKSIRIPADFPDPKVLGYYTHPVITSLQGLERLAARLKWDGEVNVAGLRELVRDSFEWDYTWGARKYIRSLAAPLLAWKLCRASEEDSLDTLIEAFHGKREHVSTDGCKEIRISFTAANVVKLNWDLEEEDPSETPLEDDDEEEDLEGGVKKSKYDPFVSERVWVPEEILRMGVKEKLAEWEKPKEPKRRTQQVSTSTATKKSRRNASKPVEKEVQRGIMSLGKIGKSTVAATRKSPEIISPQEKAVGVGVVAATQDITHVSKPKPPTKQNTNTNPNQPNNPNHPNQPNARRKASTPTPPSGIFPTMPFPARPAETFLHSPPHGRRYSALGIFGAPIPHNPSQEEDIEKENEELQTPTQPETPTLLPTPAKPIQKSKPIEINLVSPSLIFSSSPVALRSASRGPFNLHVPKKPEASTFISRKAIVVVDLCDSDEEVEGAGAEMREERGRDGVGIGMEEMNAHRPLDFENPEQAVTLALSPNVTVRKKNARRKSWEKIGAVGFVLGDEKESGDKEELGLDFDKSVEKNLATKGKAKEKKREKKESIQLQLNYSPAIREGKTRKKIMLRESTGGWQFVGDDWNVGGRRVCGTEVEVVDMTEGD